MSPLAKDTVMVVHGAEIFDTGNAAWLFSVLAPCRIVVAGIMARVAAEEFGLPCEFADIPPSMVMRRLHQPCFLANRGKSPESGRIFGEIVARRVGDEGIIHVECASGEVICWNRYPDDLAREIATLTGYSLVSGVTMPEGTEPGTRVIRGCLPGEAVFVNGTVIGVATGREVVIRVSEKGVEPVLGLSVKVHGLEKLNKSGPIDPATAWCKSGPIRAREPVTTNNAPPKKGRVVFIDHCGHTLYRSVSSDGVCGIVSVGDDTTAVCAHIGAHLGVPVFGIVDGDTDGIVPVRYAPGSVIAVATGISDDDLGKEVAVMIPAEEVDWDDFIRMLVARIGDRARICRPPHS
ncbi:MAG TPA: DUF2117 domain-containing protein [Methanolinea sp.]|nr:DUF2117 domain-containing protein [Methanolinea sp.]HPC55577.1 DUF2117 domain-containing protein [Methanolinea sp.]HQE84861.1 DUF2117 domain-containing protein [Methanolinea sp.]HQI13815.1 DUF2117 domain-containing protein [Methanolinea sp.]HQJ17874.1 DUF2117 domain-containing protein [Methanolinea sp.]